MTQTTPPIVTAEPIDADLAVSVLPRRAVGPRARAGLEARVAQWTIDGVHGNAVHALRQKAVDLQLLDRAVHFAVIKAGEILTEVKAQLHHGQFIRWVTEAVDMSPRTAQRYMALYNTFPHPSQITHVPLTELYQVAAIKQPAARAALAEDVAQITDDTQRKQLIISRIKTLRAAVDTATTSDYRSPPAAKTWPQSSAIMLQLLDRLEASAHHAPADVRDEAHACVTVLRQRIAQSLQDDA